MNEKSILWGFLGAGFLAPVDFNLALMFGAAWCFVVALMKWGPEGSSDE